MQQETAGDRNRTGMRQEPRRAREGGESGEEAGWQPMPAAPGDPVEIARVRAVYGREAGPVGTMPQPEAAGPQPAAQAARGRSPSAALLDRLGERLAHARLGARLYEMLLGKLEAALPRAEAGPVGGTYGAGAGPAGGTPGPGAAPDSGAAKAETLRRFRDLEARHFRLLWECLERLGADPTVETPSADLSGVRSMGLVRLLSDPRADFVQSLDAMLVAELADSEGWRLLVSLAEAAGRPDLAASFRAALADEDRQLETIRRWWAEANLAGTGTRPA